ncbi:hypothetical protein BWQ96_09273 [Gracilariopsis chorda]|uniref:Uncharacterized protein n=1 Tax=Gracilariopsis chorda TaxID=448386 RepID=A0A2V3IFZ1_9FLOR|nr:hypothetical protein BWQ96_09273 [Gracilariopsis chorda]|eukprot:PXF41006.1 hypothetical protein BWQ96_09273 [Gracilariopsis chorda]
MPITHPSWRFTEELVELTAQNYIQWRQNLDDILTEHEYQQLLSITFQPTTSEDHKATANLRRIITKSITEDVSDMLADPTIFNQSPAAIFHGIQRVIDNQSAKKYFSLTTEAMNLRRTGTISEYIASPLAIRRKYISANTPGISDERVTINYILQGLVNDHRFSQRAVNLMLDRPPTTISETQHRLEQYESILNQQ